MLTFKVTVPVPLPDNMLGVSQGALSDTVQLRVPDPEFVIVRVCAPGLLPPWTPANEKLVALSPIVGGGGGGVINSVRPGIVAARLCRLLLPVGPLPEAGEGAVPTLATGRVADDVKLVEPELVVVVDVAETVVDGAMTGAAMTDVSALFVAVEESFVSSLVFSIEVVIGAVVGVSDWCAGAAEGISVDEVLGRRDFLMSLRGLRGKGWTPLVVDGSWGLVRRLVAWLRIFAFPCAISSSAEAGEVVGSHDQEAVVARRKANNGMHMVRDATWRMHEGLSKTSAVTSMLSWLLRSLDSEGKKLVGIAMMPSKVSKRCCPQTETAGLRNEQARIGLK
jgi:hypothetical protein